MISKKKIAAYIEDTYKTKAYNINGLGNKWEKERLKEIVKTIRGSDFSDLETEIESLNKQLREVVKKVKGRIKRAVGFNGPYSVSDWSIETEILDSAHQKLNVERAEMTEALHKEKMDVLTRLELAEGRVEIEAIAREVGLIK